MKKQHTFWNTNKFKITLFTIIVSSLIKLFLNVIGITELKLALWNVQLNRIETTCFYYSVLFLSLIVYFWTHREKIKWAHVFGISLMPVSIISLLIFAFPQFYYKICVLLIMGIIIVNLVWEIMKYFEEKEQGNRPDKMCYLMMGFTESAFNVGIYTLYSGMMTLLIMVMVMFSPAEAMVMPISSMVSSTGENIEQKMESVVASESIIYATNVRDLETTTPTYLWEPNKDKLRLLSETVYTTLSLQERTNALQELINIECSYLGVGETCQLVAMDIENKNVAGYYRDSDRIIVLDREYVERDSSLGAISVLLHECYHCYQADCCKNYEEIKAAGVNEELLFYRDCLSWMEDMENYRSCEDTEDFETYYAYASQSLETSADSYCEEWLAPYWNFINSIDAVSEGGE